MATQVVDRHLGGGRRGPAPHPRHQHPIGTVVGQLDRVELHDHVGVVVVDPLDLVEQLRGDGADRHEAAGARVLGDHRRPVGAHLGDREAAPLDARNLSEERVVATGALGAALDDVAGDDGAREGIPVVTGPAEVRCRRAEDHRGVGDPTGDHDVGAPVERCCDAEPTEVGVGRDGLDAELVELLAGVEVGQIDAGGPQIGEPGDQVVALDIADRRGEAEPGGERIDGLGAAGGVEPAGVGHHLDAAVETGAHHLLHLGEEGLGEAATRVLHEVLGEDQHGELGQPVAGEHVDRAAVDHLAGRRESVAVEPAAVGDADRVLGGHHGSSRRTSSSWASTLSPGCTSTSATLPSIVAAMRCSTFIASSTTSVSPTTTVSPACTSTATTRPGVGAVGPDAPRVSISSGNRGCSTSRVWPAAELTQM